jgi:hypothetical protein
MSRPFASLLLPALLATTAPAVAVPLLPNFDAAKFVNGAPIDNRYLPWLPGTRAVFVGTGEEDGEPVNERDVTRVLGQGPNILGVRATTVLDTAHADGVLIERTKDYYAQDKTGNVWYLGEDVTNFNYDDDGVLLGTDSEGSWRAGRNGALPGFAMPKSTRIGLNYYQEYAPNDEAVDEGTTFALLAALDVSGIIYRNVLQVYETTAAEPDAREFKFYAPGVGLIRAMEGLDAHLRNPEVVADRIAPVPLPAGVWLLGSAAACLFGLRRRRRA